MDSSESSYVANLQAKIGLLRSALMDVESSLNSAFDLCDMNSKSVDFDVEDNLNKLSAVTSCLPSLKLMHENIEASERLQTIVSVLQALESKLRTKDTKAVSVVTWSPSLVTTPMSTYQVDQRLLTSTFSLPSAAASASYSGEGVTKKTTNRAKKQKKTFAEFLKEAENPPVSVQSEDARVMPSMHGPLPYDDIDEVFTGSIPIIDILTDDEYPAMSRDVEKSSQALREEGKVVVDSLVVETTAVEDITSDEKAFKLVVTGLDVALFLVEALLKSILPVILDGGRQAVKRIIQTLAGQKVRTPLSQWIASRKRGHDAAAESDWELLEGFENVKIV